MAHYSGTPGARGPRFIEPAEPLVPTPLPQEDPLAVHCFCVCSGSVLSTDLLGTISRSVERDLLFVLLIYPRIFLHVLNVFIVYRLLVGFLFV